MKKIKTKKGFTLIELIMVSTYMIIIVSAVFSFQQGLLQSTNLRTKTNEIIQTLRLNQAKAISSDQDSQWGVYFGTDNFIAFKGENYVTRDPSFDEIIELPNTLSISNISLNGGVSNITFEKVNGNTDNYGSIQINDNNRSKSVSINPRGVIEQNAL